MKSVLISVAMLLSVSAFANPFDGVVGQYKVIGKPQIRNENVKSCNRFDFKNIVGVKVEKDASGYQQSHMIYIQKPNGWSGHPISDFNYTNEFKAAGSYAKTAGDKALNESGTWSANPVEKETLTVSLEKSGSNYVFKMVEALYENSALTAACHYQVQLTKN
jgi:hypothetical protein